MSEKLSSENIERALLGLLILKPILIDKVFGFLKSDDFYYPDNKIIFTAIENSLKIYKKVDESLVLEEIAKLSNIPKDKWMNSIALLIADSGIENNIDSYIETIKEKRQSRDLRLSLQEATDIVSKGDKSVAELIETVESKLFDVTREKELKDFDDVEKLTGQFEDKLDMMSSDDYSDGLLTKLPNLDKKLGGLKGGQFIIVAARPSMGKTAFSLEIAKNISMQKNVGFFSLEMPAEQLIKRMISSESMIPQEEFTRRKSMPENRKRILDYSFEKVKKLNLWIDDSPSLRIGELTWKAKKLHSINKLDLIIIDYIQLIETDKNNRDNRQQAVSEISRQLKTLARELDIPVIALSQLSRRVEQREDKRPQMSDIRESGAIEQDADIIMFLYREDYYKQEDNSRNIGTSDLEVIISKHRNGETGSSKLKFDLKYGKISGIHTTYN